MLRGESLSIQSIIQMLCMRSGAVGWAFRALVAAWVFLVFGALPVVRAAQAEPAKALELNYVPSQASAVLAFASPAIHEPIRQALKATQAGAETEEKLAKLIQANLLSVLGAPTDAIEQITMVFMRPHIVQLGSPLPGQNGLIMRTRQPHDFTKVASFFPAPVEEKRHAGQVYYQGTKENRRCYFFPDERTAVVAYRETDLHALMDAGKAGAAQAAWAQAWKGVHKNHFALFVDLAALRQGIEREGKQAPHPLVLALGPLGEKGTTIAFGGNFGNGLSLSADVTCDNQDSAEKIKQSLEGFVALGRGNLGAGRQALVGAEQLPAEGKRLMVFAFDLAEGLLKNVQFRQEKQTVHVEARVGTDASVAFGAAWVMPALAQVHKAR